MESKIALLLSPNSPFRIALVNCNPESHQVLIKILCCNICGADLNSYYAKRQVETPCILGHEYVGEVISKSSVIYDYHGDEVNIGDKVIWYMIKFCRECKFCKVGLPQKCVNLQKFGHQKFEGVVNGGLSEFVCLDEDMIFYKIPQSIPDEIAASLSCAGATSVAAVRSIDNITSKSILVLGAGLLGVYLAFVLKQYGAEEVVVATDNKHRVALLNCLDNKAVSLTEILYTSKKFDVIIDAIGDSAIVQNYISHLNIAGRFILLGSTHPTQDIRINPTFITKNLIRVYGIHNYNPTDLAETIKIWSKNQNMNRVISSQFRFFELKSINQAILELESELSPKPLRISIKL